MKNSARLGILAQLGILLAGILLLAFADVIVLERIYKPLATQYHIPWNAFEIKLRFLGPDARALWWHVAFIPLGLGLFALLGLTARDGRLALAGMALFASGWEDVAYYVIQGKGLPAELPWLDISPAVAWTRWVTPGVHVTGLGLALAVVVGGSAAGLILGWRRAWYCRTATPHGSPDGGTRNPESGG